MPEKVSGKEKILEATLALMTKWGGVDVTMAQIAKAARMSRQAVYLHFSDRGELLLALVRYTDQKRGLELEVQHIHDAPTGIEGIRRMVSLQARSNPVIWPVARLLDGARRSDPEVERSWQDRLQHRLIGCRQIMRKVQDDGDLVPNVPVDCAADMLWTLTSLRMWEDLVVVRRWPPKKYEEYVFDLLRRALIRPNTPFREAR